MLRFAAALGAAADLHCGDNVKLTAGHMYKVLVEVKGEKATFTFKA